MRFPYSYKKVHVTLQRMYGPAKNHICPCGESAVEWAYQFTAGDQELRSPDGSRPHSTNPDDYAAMCRRCHAALDMKHDPVMAERRRNSGGPRPELIEKWKNDLEYREKMEGVLYRNSLAIAERRKIDPEFDAHMKRGGNGRTERMKDPEFAAQVTETLTANARVRVRCNFCGKVGNWVYVNDEEPTDG